MPLPQTFRSVVDGLPRLNPGLFFMMIFREGGRAETGAMPPVLYGLS